MEISATSIKNKERKNDLILYARSIGCSAVQSRKYNGLAVEYKTNGQKNKIEQKIKELKELE